MSATVPTLTPVPGSTSREPSGAVQPTAQASALHTLTPPGRSSQSSFTPATRAQDPVAPADRIAPAQGKAGGDYVMCPVLGSLIAEGSLHKDANGDISLKQLDDVMVHRLGITPERAAVTVGTGVLGNHLADVFRVVDGKFNIDHLKGSILDHQGQGDTGILMGGQFHPEKFDALVAHSQDGKTLTAADFANAIRHQLARDGGLVTRTKGEQEDIFEMSALINTFGTTDANGVRRIDIATLRDLYQHRKLPPAATLEARAATGIEDHAKTMAVMTADLATGSDAKEAAARHPGAAAVATCPYLGAKARAKATAP